MMPITLTLLVLSALLPLSLSLNSYHRRDRIKVQLSDIQIRCRMLRKKCLCYLLPWDGQL